jgi:hypothetical protein
MKESPKLPAAIRFPVAFGFAFLSAWLGRNLAEPVWFFKSTVGGPFHAIAEDAFWQIIFTLALVFPALWLTDWFLKSRIQAILIGLVAMLVVLWLVASL